MFLRSSNINPKGDLKKVVSTQELSKVYWDSFNKIQPKFGIIDLLREHKKQINRPIIMLEAILTPENILTHKIKITQKVKL